MMFERYKHTRTRTHARTHARTHTHTHTYTHTHAHSHTHADTHADTHGRTHARMHGRTHALTHAHSLIHSVTRAQREREGRQTDRQTDRQFIYMCKGSLWSFLFISLFEITSVDLSIEVAACYIELLLGDSGVCNAVLFHVPCVDVRQSNATFNLGNVCALVV